MRFKELTLQNVILQIDDLKQERRMTLCLVNIN